MAAGPEIAVESPDQSPPKIEGTVDSESVDFVNSDDNNNNNSDGSVVDSKKASDSGPKSEIKMQEFVDMLSSLKLNPMAKEFFPSYSIIDRNRDQSEFGLHYFMQQPGYFNNYSENVVEGYPSNRRRRNSYSSTRRQSNGRTFRAQREDSVKRTVYVSDIDHNVTEEQLAALFCGYGHVLDCRICGDPHSRLRFAFVEFGDQNSARAALNLGGAMLGFSQITVLPSKTAILPVNPTFLPRSEDEREMCARTVYCTNIDKKVSQAEVKNFFETRCGEVKTTLNIKFLKFFIARDANRHLTFLHEGLSPEAFGG
ncbi:hypothetical protein M8C21_020752 [Ambrosia artemisiifolia]|uniref:RRM domain-containing protein n=1 Tax=Ambrosia artemisiifolia TaxID=4212 RepID=A0AAD5GDQ4_AMBAR|nr:hypothetical protein M8C21_020752 [Ambrosia artemisiifolia]